MDGGAPPKGSVGLAVRRPVATVGHMTRTGTFPVRAEVRVH